MSQIKNDRLLRALNMQPVDMTPVWLMRQAGRYLPEYRKVRQAAGSFMSLCQNPELACEVSLQPLKRYALDAAIIFSDILTIPHAMGLGLHFVEGEGPRFTNPIQNEKAIEQLPLSQKEDLNYVYEAIKLVKKEISLPLIGFCGSPWTLAVYMIEGRSQSGFPKALKFMADQPHKIHKLLNKLSISIMGHCIAQVEAGADVIMLFDTWGGLLSTEDYESFSLFYLKQIITGIQEHYNSSKIPIILFTKKGNKWLKQMAASGCSAIGVDWEISLAEARAVVDGKVALQGNLAPHVLLQSADEIKRAAREIITSYGNNSGHIFNLGHGITPDVKPENVTVLVDTVHEFSHGFYRNTQE